MACYKFYEKTKQCGLTTNGISDGVGFFQPLCGLPGVVCFLGMILFLRISLFALCPKSAEAG